MRLTLPLRSRVFLNMTLAALLCSCLDAYIIWCHWRVLNTYLIVIIMLPASIQFIAQWWRGLIYLDQTTKTYEERTQHGEDSFQKARLESALSGISIILLWSYVTNILLLIGIDAILMRLDGLK